MLGTEGAPVCCADVPWCEWSLGGVQQLLAAPRQGALGGACAPWVCACMPLTPALPLHSRARVHAEHPEASPYAHEPPGVAGVLSRAYRPQGACVWVCSSAVLHVVLVRCGAACVHGLCAMLCIAQAVRSRGSGARGAPPSWPLIKLCIVEGFWA